MRIIVIIDLFCRHQSNSNTNVYFGGKRGSDYHLDFPYNQSDETTTEL